MQIAGDVTDGLSVIIGTAIWIGIKWVMIHQYNVLPLIYSAMCFNEDWRYRFTLANDFCHLELIQVALGRLDELQKAEKYSIRWSL